MNVLVVCEADGDGAQLDVAPPYPEGGLESVMAEVVRQWYVGRGALQARSVRIVGVDTGHPDCSPDWQRVRTSRGDWLILRGR